MIEGETMKDQNKKIARLIKQIQRGNQSAFEEFYKLTSPKAYFIALKITQNEHTAEDILQESYIKALEKINEIDTSQNINSWFLKIVSNKSKDLLKSNNRIIFEGEEETVFDEIPEDKIEFCPEENLNQEELRLEVMAAIDELTAEKRACIMMMYFGDMSVKEIAECIEVPESTVKNRLYTARKDLKTKFEKNGNILYGTALGGLLIWALNKTSVTASAAFLASAASAEIVAGATAAYTSGVTATASTATAASAGTGIAAKTAILSVAQKIAVGVAATAVIGGSTAGVVTVVKNSNSENTTVQITEAVTTAPVFSTEYVFNEIVLPETTAETVLSTEKETRRESTKTVTERTSTQEYTTAPASTTKPVTKKETTNRKATTTQITTTKRAETTTTEVSTEEETTTRPATTKAVTPAATEPATQSKATISIDIIDLDGSVVDTINFEVDEGTTLSREYIVTAVQAKGYEPMAGVYGDIGSVAQGGNTYKFEAEL